MNGCLTKEKMIFRVQAPDNGNYVAVCRFTMQTATGS